ncbi:PHP domain-containing protein [Pseudohaliea rubra]|uniref:Putative metal-dependent phosphoesterase (PHP family) n=1 Tax=Pseudohaliea rubra DSM 19751 TaxID=1265313 RepID=A0A095VVF7_9GAMM|nr:PHP domain-containing protein [Pseudohaliea rubra]KGE05345.1 putative metal-dependent phosphoesterase (PHP family) [Pseudohaliea rubra DSM 19751]
MLVDFHTHTTASDGALAPATLIERARAAGLAELAITDHDTLAGYRAAVPLAGELVLHAGVELSCQWSGATIHVVGLGVAVDDPTLVTGLATLGAARQARARTIAERLASRGFPGALEGARAIAGNSQLGRPHFARWLVQAGHLADEATAFKRYLGRNKPGDVKAFWPALAEVTGWITAAGGIAVLAHPLHYKFTRMKLRRLLTDFARAGGGALEVVSGRQAPGLAGGLAQLAADFDLAVSVGSDFHADSTHGPRLGVPSAPFAGQPNVWSRLAAPAGPREATAP